LIFLIFWIGVYPKPLLSYINPQTNVVVAQVVPDFFKTEPAVERVAEEKSTGAETARPVEEQRETR
jgi:hypothetical protein